MTIKKKKDIFFNQIKFPDFLWNCVNVKEGQSHMKDLNLLEFCANPQPIHHTGKKRVECLTVLKM